MAVGFTGTDFQAKPSILDPFRTIFDVFGPTWKPGLGQTWPGTPNQACRFRNFFSGPHSGTFFCKFFAAFPGDPEKSSGTCRPGWGFRAKFGPDLIFKLGQKHQKWPELAPESMVWTENRSRSMPGPLRSFWDGSNPLQGPPRTQKVKKYVQKPPGNSAHEAGMVARRSA